MHATSRIARPVARLFAAGILCAVVAAPANAQSWTDAERAQLLEALEASAKDFHVAIEGVSDVQWSFHEAEGRWSIGEVAEHLALSEEFIGGMIMNIESSAAIEAARDGRGDVDMMIVEGLKDRSQRFQAPEPVAPRRAYSGREEMLKAFMEARMGVMEFVKSTDVDLRSVSAEHPAFGPIDGHQWVLLLTSHVWRHLDQVSEVKAATGYPGR